ncbi:hypothetical protein DT23_14070 [Thioclava indica]|uniref:Uncharacterized protein n=2 Tax=Thioclava indica TaxID=1353528 RepID=A0A074JWH7_9RHOB|nr:hypothetical protein DT23_14070 [Thioclava indica]
MNTGALRVDAGKAWNTYLNGKSGPPAKEKELAPLGKLFERAVYGVQDRKHPDKIGFSRDREFPLLQVNDAQTWHVMNLIELRNQFEHFGPTGWIIELSGIPEKIEACVNIIEQIEHDGWAFRHLETSDRARLVACLKKLRDSIA